MRRLVGILDPALQRSGMAPAALTIILFMIAALAVPSTAGGSAGSTGAAFLELGIGARPAAMGEAYSAVADDPYGMYFNPAGIAGAERQTIGFTHNEHFQGISYNYLGYIWPRGENSTIGLSLLMVDLGDVQRVTWSSYNAGTNLGTAGASDLALTATYARRVGEALDMGVTAKWLREELDNYSSGAFALDLGMRYRTPVDGLTLGASVANAGTQLQFVRENEELPLSLRTGFAFSPRSRQWTLIGDLLYIKNQDIEAHVGGEYWIADILALRAGMNGGNDADDGLTLGLGFRYQDLTLDYAYVPFGDLGNANHIALAYAFGGGRETPEGETASGYETRTSVPASELYGWYIEPFENETMLSGDDWMEEATATVLADRLDEAGIAVNPDPGSARRVVSGSLYRSDDEIAFLARVTDARSGGVERVENVSGPESGIFGLWDDLADRLAGRTSEGPSGSAAPHPAAPHPAAPGPGEGPSEEPPNSAGGPNGSVRILTIRNNTGDEALDLVSTRLTAALRERLVSRGVALGYGSSARFEGAFVTEPAGGLYVYGRVLDEATGIPLRSVEARGTPDNLDSLAERLAGAVAAALIR